MFFELFLWELFYNLRLLHQKKTIFSYWSDYFCLRGWQTC